MCALLQSLRSVAPNFFWVRCTLLPRRLFIRYGDHQAMKIHRHPFRDNSRILFFTMLLVMLAASPVHAARSSRAVHEGRAVHVSRAPPWPRCQGRYRHGFEHRTYPL